MRVELPRHVSRIVNEEVVLREKRADMLANDSLAGAHLAAQHQRDADALARTLHHVGKEGDNPCEKLLVAAADVVEQMVAQGLPAVRLRRRLERESAPQIEIAGSSDRVVRIGIELDALMAPLARAVEPGPRPGHGFHFAGRVADLSEAVAEPGRECLHGDDELDPIVQRRADASSLTTTAFEPISTRAWARLISSTENSPASGAISDLSRRRRPLRFVASSETTLGGAASAR